jgi:NTP pyrophosphatase (non-canonical NTP hydrolase)
LSENWQTRAVEFAQGRNLERPPGVYALDLLSELGEVAKEILLATNYGEQAPQFRDNLAGELGDVLYSLCLLAATAGVDLEEAFTVTLRKYEQRRLRQGHPGSSPAG